MLAPHGAAADKPCLLQQFDVFGHSFEADVKARGNFGNTGGARLGQQGEAARPGWIAGGFDKFGKRVFGASLLFNNIDDSRYSGTSFSKTVES